MKLSDRLSSILKLVSSGCILADIGSDHGYLCIAHINDNNGKKAYACDINANALEQAKKTLTKYPSSKVELQLMDGITDLKQDVEEIVIAGMGFDTIKMILEHQDEKLSRLNKIIIQCNKNIDKLKSFLKSQSIYINEEHLVYDNELYYELLVCSKKDKNEYKKIIDDSLYKDYLDFHLFKIESIDGYNQIQGLKDKYEYLKKEKERIKNST